MVDIEEVANGPSVSYLESSQSGLDEHNNTYWVALMGLDDETGYAVDHDQIHQDDGNRFVIVSWFDNNDGVYCDQYGRNMNPQLTGVQFEFEIDEGNQRHTTFDEYSPNETDEESLDEDYEVGIGASIGVGVLNVGLNLSQPSEEMDYSPFEHLYYDLDEDPLGEVVPSGDDKAVGFETNITTGYSSGETVDVSLSSQADYGIFCGRLLHFSTPTASLTTSIDVVD